MENQSKNTRPLISIITISKDDPAGLRKTLKSIAEQSFSDYEVIVIPAGTSKEVEVNKFGNQFKVSLQTGVGISNAFNLGIAKAKGEWIQFLNGGDVLINSDVLAEVSAAFSEGIDIVSGYSKLDKAYGKIPRSPLKTWRNWLYMSHQASWYRNDLFKKFGKFSEIYKIRMDLEWIYRLPKSTPKLFLERTFVIFEFGGISSRSVIRFSLEELAILRQHKSTWPRLIKVVFLSVPVRLLRSPWRYLNRQRNQN